MPDEHASKSRVGSFWDLFFCWGFHNEGNHQSLWSAALHSTSPWSPCCYSPSSCGQLNPASTEMFPSRQQLPGQIKCEPNPLFQTKWNCSIWGKMRKESKISVLLCLEASLWRERDCSLQLTWDSGGLCVGGWLVCPAGLLSGERYHFLCSKCQQSVSQCTFSWVIKLPFAYYESTKCIKLKYC